MSREYTSEEEADDPTQVGFRKIAGETVGADDAVDINGAYAVITWFRADKSDETLTTLINSDPTTSYVQTRKFVNSDDVLPVNYDVSSLGILRTTVSSYNKMTYMLY